MPFNWITAFSCLPFYYCFKYLERKPQLTSSPDGREKIQIHVTLITGCPSSHSPLLPWLSKLMIWVDQSEILFQVIKHTDSVLYKKSNGSSIVPSLATVASLQASLAPRGPPGKRRTWFSSEALLQEQLCRVASPFVGREGVWAEGLSPHCILLAPGQFTDYRRQ